MALNTYRDLRVYQQSLDLCFRVFETTKKFPSEERYGLTDQVRRSSRSICANLAEAWHRRRYPAAFVAKLNDAEGEAAETQVWVDLACRCGYLGAKEAEGYHSAYDHVLAQLALMVKSPEKWALRQQAPTPPSAPKEQPSGVSR